MSPNNNALLTQRELLLNICQLLENDELAKGIDRIPITMRPKNRQNIRCCVHKDRAVLKYKLMAMLGFDINDESDELTSLATYVERHLQSNNQSDKMMTVVDEACSACVKNNYIVTNMCRGCDARGCALNCPKKCISFVDGKANINHDDCVNCGLCMNNCPFHAIIYVPVPCEEVCPVSAIKKDENGIEFIDFDKCINCGKCITACPFGAIVEKTSLPSIYNLLKSETKVTALIAPAIAGQFKASFGKIKSSISQLGFDKVVEVAEGADMTIDHEFKELKKRTENGESFITNSCCSSYNRLMDLHIPELNNHRSSTKTPLQFIAEKEKLENKDAITIFIGPCISKRLEVHHDPNVDFMMSFQELGASLVAKKIEITNCTEEQQNSNISDSARGFSVSGGVAQAVKTMALKHSFPVNEVVVNGIDKENIKVINNFLKNNKESNFLEVMSCENGCVGGCNTIARPMVAKRQINAISKQ